MHINAVLTRFHPSFARSLICRTLPAWYRLALLRQELSTLDGAAAEAFLARVRGRLA